MTISSLGLATRRDGEAGFLLTETLAAFAISALVLLGLVSASSILLRSVNRSVAHVQEVDDLSSTLNAVARDVASLTRARWNGVEPQPFVFKGAPNSLFFVRAQRDPDGSNQTYVIALREIVAGHSTRLMRSEARLSGHASGFDSLYYRSSRELGTGSARLRFYYVPAMDDKGEQPQRDTWPSGSVLPGAILIEAFGRDTGRTIVSMRMPIRPNADIDCVKQSGFNAEIALPRTMAPNGFCGRADANKSSDDPRNTNTELWHAPSPQSGPTP